MPRTRKSLPPKKIKTVTKTDTKSGKESHGDYLNRLIRDGSRNDTIRKELMTVLVDTIVNNKPFYPLCYRCSEHEEMQLLKAAFLYQTKAVVNRVLTHFIITWDVLLKYSKLNSKFKLVDYTAFFTGPKMLSEPKIDIKVVKQIMALPYSGRFWSPWAYTQKLIQLDVDYLLDGTTEHTIIMLDNEDSSVSLDDPYNNILLLFLSHLSDRFVKVMADWLSWCFLYDKYAELNKLKLVLDHWEPEVTTAVAKYIGQNFDASNYYNAFVNAIERTDDFSVCILAVVVQGQTDWTESMIALDEDFKGRDLFRVKVIKRAITMGSLQKWMLQRLPLTIHKSLKDEFQADLKELIRQLHVISEKGVVFLVLKYIGFLKEQKRLAGPFLSRPNFMSVS